MTEYERLKEEIIATAAGYTDDIKALTTRLMTIISDKCVLKDNMTEGALIDRLRYQKGEGLLPPVGQRFASEHYENPYKLGKELFEWLQRIKEIKKEAKS